MGIVQKKSMVLVKIKQRLGDMLLNLLIFIYLETDKYCLLFEPKYLNLWTICISFLELVCDIIKRC